MKIAAALLLIAPIAFAGSPPKPHWEVAEGSPKQLQAVIDAQGDAGVIPRAIQRCADKGRGAERYLARLENGRASDTDIAAQKLIVAKLKARYDGLKNGTALAYPDFTAASIHAGPAGQWGFTFQYRVQQIIDDNNCIVSINDGSCDEFDFWITGISTVGWTDDKKIYGPDLPLVFTGTKKYGTVIGSGRTIFLAQPFTDKDFVLKK